MIPNPEPTKGGLRIGEWQNGQNQKKHLNSQSNHAQQETIQAKNRSKQNGGSGHETNQSTAKQTAYKIKGLELKNTTSAKKRNRQQ